MPRSLASAAVLAAVLALPAVARADAAPGAAGSASAQPPATKTATAAKTAPAPHRNRVRWDPAWPHANAWDYTLAGVGATTALVEAIVLQPMRPPLHWTDPILFDSDVRDALRLTDPTGRDVLEGVSWGLWGAQLALPLLVDVPYAWGRYGFWLARDLFWQDAATLTVAAALDLGLRNLAGRARPLTYDCLSHGGTNCLDGVETTRSFPGGHLINATAASVLACTQHLYTHLYGGPWDAVACATTLASDMTITVLRVVTDNHWATDQLAGLAIGALVGWGVPYLMHYRFHGRPAADETSSSSSPPGALILPVPLAYEGGGGLGVAAIF